ncbi:MAG: M56 family metallopeptidase [Gemmatimonadaceae bacterium]
MIPFSIELLAKSSLILALGLCVAVTLRGATASLRHLILLATLGGALVLPAAMSLAPKWDVAVIPTPAAARTIGNDTDPGSALGSATDRGSRVARDAVSLGGTAGTRRLPTASPRDATPGIGAGVQTSPATLLVSAWLIGLLAVVAWLVTGRLRLARIARTAWPLIDPEWTKILNQARTEAGLQKGVLLCASPAVSTPLTWGSRAPVILLPEDAPDWREDHRRIVLRHELAHVARSDSLTQLLAGVVCALYWFNPFVWIAERRLRAECERACDDRVVSLGTPGPEYASHLLEVARSARAFGAAGFLSVAMARPSQLEGRLLAVLNESQRRASISRATRLAAVSLSAAMILPLSAFHAVPRTSSAITGESGVTVPSDIPKTFVTPSKIADSTIVLSAPVKAGGSLDIDLRTGGKVIVASWDRSEVSVRASLGGRDWRNTRVTLNPIGGNARLESRFTTESNSESTRHVFEITVPRNFSLTLKSSGGSLSMAGVSGSFSGTTGGGEINLERMNGQVNLETGGGDVVVRDSRLSGSVRTGGGVVRMMNVTGNMKGYSGTTGISTVYTDSAEANYGSGSGAGIGTSSSSSSSSFTFVGPTNGAGSSSSQIMMASAGGPISLRAAPNGARVVTGGGRIRIGASDGFVYAETGGGAIDVGPSRGSVQVQTGAGDVNIELEGPDAHSVNIASGTGNITVVAPSDLNATLDLESAYTENLGHKTRITSDWPVTPTETSNWDATEGTPRRYVRVRQNIGRGGALIRVRTVNGNIVLKRN